MLIIGSVNSSLTIFTTSNQFLVRSRFQVLILHHVNMNKDRDEFYYFHTITIYLMLFYCVFQQFINNVSSYKGLQPSRYTASTKIVHIYE